jgi:uncharacterized protein with HEPN domain
VNRDAVYLGHILDGIARIERYSAVGQARFLAESHWQDAMIRQLEVIGEATKRLSPELRGRYPEVAWRRMAGLRDVLFHDYMGVDLDVVWGVAQRALPDLKRQIQMIVDEHDRV